MEFLGGLFVIVSLSLALACVGLMIAFVIRWIMKKSKKSFGFIGAACALLSFILFIAGICVIPPVETNEDPPTQSEETVSSTAITSSSETIPATSEIASANTTSPSTTSKAYTSAPPQTTEPIGTVTATATTPPTSTSTTFSAETTASTPAGEASTGISYPDAGSLPGYSGASFSVLNNNFPNFTSSDLTAKSFEYYSELDALGRCGMTYACIGRDIMPTEGRGSIGQVKPTGWHTVKYDIVDGKYLYNRCHLIGYQLTGENANVCNLITGTRSMNVDGMLPFENMVADYVKETGNHVLYRVIPIFEGNELVARGVTIEGYSVEDNGEGICFNVYVYNVQPGIEIDYATGESKLIASVETTVATTQTTTKAPETTTTKAPQTTSATATETTTAAPPPATTEATATEAPETTAQTTEEEPPETSDQIQYTYVLNINSKKFHYPSCKSVEQMKETNRKYVTWSREEAIANGYEPCGNCHP